MYYEYIGYSLFFQRFVLNTESHPHQVSLWCIIHNTVTCALLSFALITTKAFAVDFFYPVSTDNFHKDNWSNRSIKMAQNFSRHNHCEELQQTTTGTRSLVKLVFCLLEVLLRSQNTLCIPYFLVFQASRFTFTHKTEQMRFLSPWSHYSLFSQTIYR